MARMKPFNIDTDAWYDRLIEFGREHPAAGRALLAVCQQYPTKRAALRLLALLDTESNMVDDLRRLIRWQAEQVCTGGYKREFRYSFHRYPRTGNHVSACPSLFAKLSQSLQYFQSTKSAEYAHVSAYQ